MTTRKLARLLDRDCLVRHVAIRTDGMTTEGIIRDVYESLGVLWCTVEVDTLTGDNHLARAEHDVRAEYVLVRSTPDDTYTTALEALNQCSE